MTDECFGCQAALIGREGVSFSEDGKISRTTLYHRETQFAEECFPQRIEAVGQQRLGNTDGLYVHNFWPQGSSSPLFRRGGQSGFGCKGALYRFRGGRVQPQRFRTVHERVRDGTEWMKAWVGSGADRRGIAVEMGFTG